MSQFQRIFLPTLKNKQQIEKPDLNVLSEHFKSMNFDDIDSDHGGDSPLLDYHDENEHLNSPATCGEIEWCIRNLKYSKSPAGLDNILNEYKKNTKFLMLPLYVKLFNAVLDSGIIPNTGVEGIIIPLCTPQILSIIDLSLCSAVWVSFSQQF